MRRTIFEGTINGETFDSVQTYNARMNELVNSGEVINASSNTRIEYVDAPTNVPTLEPAVVETPVDEDLSFYPYMDNDDPFYLDILVATDTDQNRAALDEVNVILDKCKTYIEDALNDEDVCTKTKVNYLEDIREILESIDQDAENTVKARKSVLDKRAILTKEFELIRDKYEQDIKDSLNEEILLNSAAPVIATLKTFYKDVETMVEENLADCQCNCGDNCTCHKNDEPVTESREVEPTRVSDLSTLLDTIFGPCGFRRNRLS